MHVSHSMLMDVSALTFETILMLSGTNANKEYTCAIFELTSSCYELCFEKQPYLKALTNDLLNYNSLLPNSHALVAPAKCT